jgi:hypothetical protein
VKELKMTHLSINNFCKLQGLYRQGVTVPELAKQFKVDYKTVVEIGRGPKVSVYNKLGKVIFNGFDIEAQEFCEKHPKKWSYKISH